MASTRGHSKELSHQSNSSCWDEVAEPIYSVIEYWFYFQGVSLSKVTLQLRQTLRR